jgi:hypothetical protein
MQRAGERVACIVVIVAISEVDRKAARCQLHRMVRRHRLCIRANGITVNIKGSRLEAHLITLRAAARALARVPRVRGKPHSAHNHPRFHSPPQRAPSVQPR